MKQGGTKGSLGTLSRWHNPPKFLFLSSPVLIENPSPGATVSSSHSVAGHNIPLKDGQSPANTSLKPQFSTKLPDKWSVFYSMYSATHLPAWEKERRILLCLCDIKDVFIHTYCLPNLYYLYWSMTSCTQNWQVPQGLTFFYTKEHSSPANNRNWAVTTCFLCLQSTTWSLRWQADHITKSIIQGRLLTVVPIGTGHLTQRKSGTRLTL